MSAAAASALNVETPHSAGYPAAGGGPQDTTWWETMVYVWDKVDGVLANFFGLNQSKYQWAVDEYNRQRMQEDSIYLNRSPDSALMKQQAELDDKLEAQPPPAQLMLEGGQAAEGQWRLVRG